MAIVGVGQLTLTDLNDAIISGTAPTNPILGSLWIDESISPKKLKKWNGSSWAIIGEVLDDGTGAIIEDVTETLGNMANDNILNYNERQVIKDKLTDIIGYVIADTTTTLPTTSTLDAGLKGNFYMYRKRALNAGLLSSDAKYTAVATKYNDLKTYLEGLTPIDAWDLRTANQNTNITVTKSTFRDKWLQYYLAIEDLAEATTQKLKDNVTDVIVGTANYASNGNFAQALADALWSSNYTGQTSEIVDISTETPPFKYAYHVKNTTNANGGIFQPTIWSGAVAEGLVNQEVTVSFWLKYTGIVQGTNSWNKGRFGEIVITGQKADLTYAYSYPAVVDQVVGANSGWVKYSKTIKLSLPSGTTKLTNIAFKHGLEGCVGEFWTTGIQIEIGNKVTDWKTSHLDLEAFQSDVLFKIADDRIITIVTGSSTYTALDTKAQRAELMANRALMQGHITVNPIFDAWTSTYPVGYGVWSSSSNFSKETAQSKSGNALRFAPTVSTTQTGLQILSSAMFSGHAEPEYVVVELDFKLISGTIGGAGVLVDWGGYSSTRRYALSIGSEVASPVLNKWYTVSKVVKKPTGTFTGSFTNMQGYIMGNYNTGLGTISVKDILFDRLVFREATVEEIKSYESDIMITDMSSDSKVTPVEKVQLKKEWATISAEKPTYETLATTYGVTTEKTNFTNAYNTLDTTLNGTSGILLNMTITSSVTASTFRAQFDDYYDKKALLTKKISEIAKTIGDLANEKISLNIDTTNYCPNPSFEGKSATFYTALTPFAKADAGVPANAPKNYVGRQTGRDNYASDFFTVKAGDRFIVEGWVASTDSTQTFGLGLNSQDNAGTNTWHVRNHKAKDVNGAWMYIREEYTIPMNHTKARFFSQINASSTFGNWFMTDIRITKIIMDDAIASADSWNNSVKDFTFEKGYEYWKQNKELTATPTGVAVVSGQGKTGGNALQITESSKYMFYSKPVPIDPTHTYKVTFRVKQTVQGSVANTSKIYAGVAGYNVNKSPLSTSTFGTHRWCAVAGRELLVAEDWMEFTGTINGEGDEGYDQFIAGTRYISPVFIVNYAGGTGTAIVDMCMVEDITTTNDIVIKVGEIEEEITSDAIMKTISTHTTYKLDLEGKVSSGVLGEYASKGDLEELGTTVGGQITDALDGLQLESTYATQQALEETSTNLTRKFSATGGMNLLKNSIGYADFGTSTGAQNFFGEGATTRVNRVQNTALDSLGFGSGFDFVPSTAGSNVAISQYVTVIPNVVYTLSWYINKVNSSSSANDDGAFRFMFEEPDGVNVGQVKFNSETKTNGYEAGFVNFTPTTSKVKIRAYAHGLCDATISGLMFSIGDIALQWSLATGESYNTNVRLDINGIRVSQMETLSDDTKQEIGYTQISPAEFAGYYTDGNGGFNKVFYLNGDETVTKKLKAIDEITMGSIKIIRVPMEGQTSTYEGWAFVPVGEG